MILQRHRQDGFSLIEMLVALVILSMSLGMLYQAAAGAIRNVRVNEHYSYAILMAESLLAQHAVVAAGGIHHQGESENYRWQLVSTSLSAPMNHPAITLYQLEIEIVWGDGGQLRRVALTTVVPEIIRDE